MFREWLKKKTIWILFLYSELVIILNFDSLSDSDDRQALNIWLKFGCRSYSYSQLQCNYVVLYLQYFNIFLAYLVISML